MKIHVFVACRNEEILLPYFLRHYAAFADRITVFDDGSTDRTPELLDGHPKVRRVAGRSIYSDQEGKLSDELLLTLKNEAYKSSRGEADWVIVADVDEFLYHPDLVGLLRQYREDGVTLPSTQGYEMVSHSPPCGGAHIYDEVRFGFRNPSYSKNAVFNPILDIGYRAGCHRCIPSGPVKRSDGVDLKFLHFRFLGSSYFARRYADRLGRLSEGNIRRNWATYLAVPGQAGGRKLIAPSEEELIRYYNEILSQQLIEEVIPAPRA